MDSGSVRGQDPCSMKEGLGTGDLQKDTERDKTTRKTGHTEILPVRRGGGGQVSLEMVVGVEEAGVPSSVGLQQHSYAKDLRINV